MASAAALNLYRSIEAGDIEAWDAPEPEPDVPGLDPFFGCGEWSPAREYRTVPLEWCCILATREVCIVDVCSVCFSGYTNVRRPHDLVCMGVCQGSKFDATIAALLN